MVMTTDEVEAFCARRPGVWALVIGREGGCRVFNEGLLALRLISRASTR